MIDIAKALASARAFGLITREGDETYGERPEEATMSERLTDEDLARLERLHAAGSAAPWTSNRGYEQQDPGVYVCPGDSGVIIACEDQGPSEADADLMVAARNALPALVAEVRRLRVERDRATTQAERAVEERELQAATAHGLALSVVARGHAGTEADTLARAVLEAEKGAEVAKARVEKIERAARRVVSVAAEFDGDPDCVGEAIEWLDSALGAEVGE